MKAFWALLIALLPTISVGASAEKLTLARVAINPGPDMLWIARDAGFLAECGFNGGILKLAASRGAQGAETGLPLPRE